jgi:hypothetical protein
MKRTVSYVQIEHIYKALRQLDGRETVLPAAADQPAKSVIVPFKLGITRGKIQRNLAALRKELDVFEETRRSIFQEIAEGAAQINQERDPVKYRKLTQQWNDAAEAEVAVDFVQVSEAELALEINDIPLEVLEVLDFLIVRDE